MTVPTLTTRRLTLRPIHNDDLAGYAAIWSNEEFAEHVGGVQNDPDAIWHAMAGNAGCWALTGVGPWSVVERASGDLVGRAGLWNEPNWPGVEVVWFLGRPWWGRGYATEAATAAISWVFGQQPELEEVVSVIRAANARSVRVAERLGMRHASTKHLHGADKRVYLVSREQWKQTPRARPLTADEAAAIVGPEPDDG